MASVKLDNDGTENDDGSAKTSKFTDNSENYVDQPRSSYSGEEINGDKSNKEIAKFEDCKYKRTTCKYIDNYGKCVAENCLFDKEEQAPLTDQFWTKCIICDGDFSVDPRDLKAYICENCRERIYAAEKLPFTCVHCGSTQNSPSKIMFSRICDECFNNKLWNDRCKKFDLGGPYGPA